MKIAITLPQLGRASSGKGIRTAAKQAEALGYDDLWVNDHISFPVGQTHPAPWMYDPLLSLATAASVTSTIGLGSQITAAYYPPVYLANALASLDSLGEGRLKIAIGAGWSEKEFEALGSDFHSRGRRTDEILTILRTCWENPVAEFKGEFYQFPPLKILPPPAHRISIWIAGTSRAARRRAVRLGDGYHGLSARKLPSPDSMTTLNEQLPALVRELRAERADPAFVCSMYTHDWDPAEADGDLIRREWDQLQEAGVQHVTAALARRDIESWLKSVETLARIVGL
jgi:probable F420-dependent oxidoreductase